jgi:hypothetical protein
VETFILALITGLGSPPPEGASHYNQPLSTVCVVYNYKKKVALDYVSACPFPPLFSVNRKAEFFVFLTMDSKFPPESEIHSQTNNCTNKRQLQTDSKRQTAQDGQHDYN